MNRLIIAISTGLNIGFFFIVDILKKIYGVEELERQTDNGFSIYHDTYTNLLIPTRDIYIWTTMLFNLTVIGLLLFKRFKNNLELNIYDKLFLIISIIMFALYGLAKAFIPTGPFF